MAALSITGKIHTDIIIYNPLYNYKSQCTIKYRVEGDLLIGSWKNFEELPFWVAPVIVI